LTSKLETLGLQKKIVQKQIVVRQLTSRAIRFRRRLTASFGHLRRSLPGIEQIFGSRINVFESFWRHIRNCSGEGKRLVELQKYSDTSRNIGAKS